MIRALANVSVRAVRTAKPVQFRAFSEKLDIPIDGELQAGRAKAEIDATNANTHAFSKSAIIPDENAGTKENPILVYSNLHERAVGYEDPATHAMVWFNLKAGPLHYVPDVNLYFKLAH